MREREDLLTTGSMFLGLAFLEVVVGQFGVKYRGFVVLRHHREIHKVPQLELLLVHPEVFLQAIVLAALRLLPETLELVLQTFPCIGNAVFETPDPLFNEWKHPLLDDLLEDTHDVVAILHREAPPTDKVPIQVQLEHNSLLIQVSHPPPFIIQRGHSIRGACHTDLEYILERVLLLHDVLGVLEDLRIVCRVQNQDVDLHRLLRFVKDTLLIEAWQVISSLKHIDGTQGVMLGGHDEVEECDGLVE